jgi:hypothetical protein
MFRLKTRQNGFKREQRYSARRPGLSPLKIDRLLAVGDIPDQRQNREKFLG